MDENTGLYLKTELEITKISLQRGLRDQAFAVFMEGVLYPLGLKQNGALPVKISTNLEVYCSDPIVKALTDLVGERMGFMLEEKYGDREG